MITAALEIMADRARTIPASGNATNATLKLLIACLLSQAVTGLCIARIAIGQRNRILEGKKTKPPAVAGVLFYLCITNYIQKNFLL